MAPAKATRPGFRPSLANAYTDARKADTLEINLFHPIYHSYTCLVGSRIDVDRSWPVHLEDEDAEDLIDLFSEPPQFIERLSPVWAHLGEEVVSGRNSTELMLKVYRSALELFDGIGRFIQASMRRGRTGAPRVPFLSLAIDPDTLQRLIEMDYESGESTYAQLVRQFTEGVVAPCLTTPFHALLPLMSEAEIRLSIRITFVFYNRLLRKYHEFLRRHHDVGLLVVPFWMPECAFSSRIEAILREELHRFCKKERLGKPHLVLLLDCEQAQQREFDALMKSWNLLDNGNGASPNGSRRRPSGNGYHPGVEQTSVVFRDRTFSEWVIYANPSVKKLLDRTIAKVDSDLNKQEVHYGWAHFEELEALVQSPKSVLNFRQKLIKLTELGYVPLSPDFYVRGKLNGQLGHASTEPRLVRLRENSSGFDWFPQTDAFCRWQGFRPEPATGNGRVLEHRRFVRQTPAGAVEEESPQCWKLAWVKARQTCCAAVVGDLETCQGGMAEALADFTGLRKPQARRDNVQEFLAAYTHVYWREHFIQHDLSEADINVQELANACLRAGGRPTLSPVEAAIAGAAAQAVFFALDSGRSCGTRFEHMDQRAFYQNVVMLTLALCNGVYVYHWIKDTRRARKLVDLLKTELIGFERAYARYDLAAYGVTRKCWEDALRSHTADSEENVVARAASRVAALHLRPLGYARDFSREEELKTVNVGHLWSTEMASLNLHYENQYFCGVNEA